MTKINPIIECLMRADDAYFNKQPLMSDTSYDICREIAEKMYPNDPYFKLVGAPVRGAKVKLSVLMPSMEKKSPDEAITWMNKNKGKYFIILPKIDGLAAQLTYVNRKLVLATTRGDGVEGRDITEYAKHVVGVWSTISDKYKKKTVIIRGELTMHRSVFAELNLDKYVNTLSLCRSMLTAKTPDTKILNKMVLIPYGWQEVNKAIPSKWDQLHKLAIEQFISITNCGPINYYGFNWLQSNMNMRFIPQKKFEPFKFSLHDKPVQKAWILSTLAFLRTSFDLDMDGLVITLNVPQKKDGTYSYKIKPDVLDQEHARGTIKTIEYNLTARGILAPVGILQKPVSFNGTQVKRFSLHNFKQIQKDHLGPGSIVELIKSGDVIPRYMKCVKAKGYEMPKRCPSCKAVLLYNGTHLLCDSPKCLGSNLPLIQNFFSKLKVDALGPGTIETFAKAGYTSVSKILGMSPKTMSKLERMGEKSAEKVIASLKKMVSKWRLHEFMAASGMFASATTSLGETLLQTICEKYSLADFSKGNIKPYELTALPNIGQERAELFIDSLPDFMRFYHEVNAVVQIKFTETAGGKLSGKTFVFSNFRNPELEETIKKHGGKVGSSVSLATTAIFCEGSSGKIARANMLIAQGAAIDKCKPQDAVAYIEKALKG